MVRLKFGSKLKGRITIEGGDETPFDRFHDQMNDPTCEMKIVGPSSGQWIECKVVHDLKTEEDIEGDEDESDEPQQITILEIFRLKSLME